MVLRRLRSPIAGVPVGALAGLIATAVLWRALRDTEPAQTVGSALIVAGGVGLALAATVATVWYGVASTGEDR